MSSTGVRRLRRDDTGGSDCHRVSEGKIPRALRPVLVVSAVHELVDEVRRCAIAAGSEADVITSLAEARSRWTTAEVVVVGEDQLLDNAARSLPSRPNIVVVGRDLSGPLPWRLAVVLGAEAVLDIASDLQALVERLTPGSSARARVIAVTSGSGGAGASVTAAALAMCASGQGWQSVLVDVDPDSPGADLLLGLDETPGLRWENLSDSSGAPPGDRLVTSLPRVDNCAVLTRDRSRVWEHNPLLIGTTIQALSKVSDRVVIDVPRAHPELRDAVITTCDVVYVVATCDLRGASSAMRVVEAIRSRADVQLLTRARAGDSLDPLDLADWLQLPLAANLPHESGITSAVDRGEPIGRHRRSQLVATCSELIRGVGT